MDVRRTVGSRKLSSGYGHLQNVISASNGRRRRASAGGPPVVTAASVVVPGGEPDAPAVRTARPATSPDGVRRRSSGGMRTAKPPVTATITATAGALAVPPDLFSGPTSPRRPSTATPQRPGAAAGATDPRQRPRRRRSPRRFGRRVLSARTRPSPSVAAGAAGDVTPPASGAGGGSAGAGAGAGTGGGRGGIPARAGGGGADTDNGGASPSKSGREGKPGTPGGRAKGSKPPSRRMKKPPPVGFNPEAEISEQSERRVATVLQRFCAVEPVPTFRFCEPVELPHRRPTSIRRAADRRASTSPRSGGGSRRGKGGKGGAGAAGLSAAASPPSLASQRARFSDDVPPLLTPSAQDDSTLESLALAQLHHNRRHTVWHATRARSSFSAVQATRATELARALNRREYELPFTHDAKFRAYDHAAGAASSGSSMEVVRLSAQRHELQQLLQSLEVYATVIAVINEASVEVTLGPAVRELVVVLLDGVRDRIVLTPASYAALVEEVAARCCVPGFAEDTGRDVPPWYTVVEAALRELRQLLDISPAHHVELLCSLGVPAPDARRVVT